MSNNPSGKGGFQERRHQINKKGRPKKIDDWRDLLLQIAHEPARRDGQPVTIDGHTVTVAEAIARELAKKNPELFLAYAFGKPPSELKLTLSSAALQDMPDEELDKIADDGSL